MTTATLGNGASFLLDRRIKAQRAADAARRAKLSPAELAAEDAARRKIQQKNIIAFAWGRKIAETTVPGYTIAGPELTAQEKEIQKLVLARDWDTLFDKVPPTRWGQNGMLGKYSFIDRPIGTISTASRVPLKTSGSFLAQAMSKVFQPQQVITGKTVREYIPFSPDDIRRWVFSRHYRQQMTWPCPDSMREAGVNHFIKANAKHKGRFQKTDWRHIYPIYPGRVYCKKPKKSLWDKIKKPLAIAVGIVAAVYLGPIVYDKIGGALAGAGGGAGGTTTGGVVGAGAKSGAIAIKAGTTAASAASKATLLSKVKAGISLYNKASMVNDMIKGRIPGPPIGIAGKTFTDLAFNLAKRKIIEEAKEKAAEIGIEYIQKKMTEKEERAIKREIEAMQRELDKLIPKGTPIQPAKELAPPIRNKIIEMQDIEKERSENLALGMMAAFAGGLLLVAG